MSHVRVLLCDDVRSEFMTRTLHQHPYKNYENIVRDFMVNARENLTAPRCMRFSRRRSETG